MIGLVSKIKISLIVTLALTLVAASIVSLMIVPIVHSYSVTTPNVSAPDFTMTDLNGGTHDFRSYISGNVTVLEFMWVYVTNTTEICPYCKAETGALDTINSIYGKDITLVAVDANFNDWSSGNSTIVSYDNGTLTTLPNGTVTYTTMEDANGVVNGTGWSLYGDSTGITGSGVFPQIFIINSTGYVVYADVSDGTIPLPNPPLPASLLEQQLDSLMWDLNVYSTYGSCSPGTGDNFYPDGSSVTCTVTSPADVGWTGYICTSWTGTGSATSGTNSYGQSNSTTFTITENSTITWNWGSSYPDVDNVTAWQMMTNGSFPNLVFLDVRMANEGDFFSDGVAGYDEGHIYNAILMPWDANISLGWDPTTSPLVVNITQLAPYKNNPIIVYCHSAHRSSPAAAFLVTQGFTKVYNFLGDPAAWTGIFAQAGMQGWKLAGLPYVNASAYMFVQGEDDRIYYQGLNGTDWGLQGWNVLPGSTVASPAAAMLWGNVTNGNDTMFVAVQGSDGSSIWYGSMSLNVNSSNYNTFNGWTQLTGATPSAPTLASNGTVLSLVVRGEDNRIYYRSYIGGSWGSWFVVPTGATVDSPAAAFLNGSLYIVVRGMDGSSLWATTMALNGTVISTWQQLPGATNARPALASLQDLDELYLAVKGMDNRIYYIIYSGSTNSWGSWSALPTGATDTGPAVTVAGNEIYTIVQGMDGSSLWLGYSDGGTNTFSGWISPNGATPSPPTLAG